MLESNVTLADQCGINVAAYLYYVEVKSKAGLFDVTKFTESFAKGLVEIAFDFKDLIDLNLHDANFPAVDIGSTSGDAAFQVTISGGSDKIESTLEIFVRHKHDQTYKRLVFIVLGEKQGSYESKKIAENAGTFKFNPYDDVYDLRQLYAMIVKEGNPEKLQALRDLIARELGPNVSNLLKGYRRTEENLEQLFKAHDVSATCGASAMQSYGVDRETFCHIDRLNQKLTGDMARFLADEFAVSVDWITGESSHIYDSMPDGIKSTSWRRSLTEAYELVDKYHANNQLLSVVLPAHLSIEDFETPYSREEAEKIAKNDVGNPCELAPHYFIVAESSNSFGAKRYRWLANEPVQHSKIGIYLLFLAAEIWRTVNSRNHLINLQTASYWDMRSVQSGELLLVDLLRYANVVRNHADYIYVRNDAFIATDVAKLHVDKLRDEIENFVAKCRPKGSEGILLPAVLC